MEGRAIAAGIKTIDQPVHPEKTWDPKGGRKWKPDLDQDAVSGAPGRRVIEPVSRAGAWQLSTP